MSTNRPFVAPVSYAQERLWFLDRLEPGRATYNIPVALHLTGHLEKAVVNAALSDLIKRHETLRTRFGMIDGEPMQIIDEVMKISVAWLDVTDLPVSQRLQASYKRAEEDARLPFDLERSPLIRATLVRRDHDQYTLLLTLHHIISDLWSTSVLLNDLGAFLDAYRNATPVQLPALPIQYVDFAQWQRQRLSGDYLAQIMTYWKQQIGDAPPVMTFPPDHPRPSPQSFRGQTLLFKMPAEVRDTMAELCRKENATLFMGLLACFKLVLGRYAGSKDVLVGTPIAGRTRPEIEKLIGFFVNTLVLRTQLDGDPTFRELLQRVNQVTLSAYDHQDLPFEKLVSELGVERRLDRSPLFQVLFGLQTTQKGGVTDEEGAHNETMEWGEISTGTAKFDVTVLVKEVKSGLEGGFEYATDLYEAETIEAIIQGFCSCVRLASMNPDWRISKITRESMVEQGSILVGQSQAVSTKSCIELFNHIAEEFPQSVALKLTDGRSITFAEFAELTDRFAHALAMIDIQRGSLVGIALQRSFESVVAVLGILKAGAAYVPLDPAYPLDRLAYMVKNVDLDGIIGPPQLVANLGLSEERCIDLDIQQLVLDQTDIEKTVGPAPQDLAYIIFTSGSSGLPKGVAMPHGPLINLIKWQLAQEQGAPDRGVPRTMHLAPLSFDVSFQELFSTWCAGGTVILCDESLRRDPCALLEWAREQGAQRIYLPPALLQLLAETTSHLQWPESLDEIITAGEALRITPAIHRLLDGIGKGILRNQYGPSESHVVTEYSMPLGIDNSRIFELPPIGTPIDNASLYVLDELGYPVPRGARGELYLGGAVLAHGYIGYPQLTAERFLPDPFSASADTRMYRTGDLVRLRLDGSLEFHGRVDDQLKIHGYRIEPAEVEAALEELPGVSMAAVVGTQATTTEHTRLLGFVVGDSETLEHESVQMSMLRGKLPSWMIPDRIVVMPQLPLLPSGKVDRRKLRRLEIPVRVESTDLIGPRSELEAAICLLWSEVLPDLESIDVRESFFNLGGHSIAAAQVAVRVRDRMNVDVPLHVFFEATSIEELAKAIVEIKAGELSDQQLQAVLERLETENVENSATDQSVISQPSTRPPATTRRVAKVNS